MRIVFFGTPDFAAPSLRALLGEGFSVVAVVTQPDKPRGRSSRMVPPPVKVVALEEDVPVLQPETPNTPQFIEQFKRLEPDIAVVVAYGHILKPEILSIPKHGFVNVHASLLPKLRGAAPIQHAILNGFDETGVSIMRIEEGLDSGPVLLTVPTPIANDETAGELTVRLAELGALAIVEGLELIQLEQAQWEPQDHANATIAPKISREVARIDWNRPAAEIARLVRAMDPQPGAWTEFDQSGLKLFGPTEADLVRRDSKPGEIVETRPAFVVATQKGALQFLDVQPAGKKRMAALEWIRGRGAEMGQMCT
ncbi:MAG: methionyl-tRNA formyltransferase [Gemmatimonadota bacterium]|nr:methionyl-tRNA formyltransferase [Gemmatimonadota bacterium]MDH5804190.1 methionyl-tRNA formyltransferase [Gemmatimonadota bacterium]